ncbi:enoyl-CoA hydratase-related protein [Nocardia sp. NPDC057227]|uniref:enoyl-CoA hydratase-related protein n=1 Tax=Nocardia sp. NPDC057227 TaxID=3346056 RepID=UPI00362B4A04
MTIRVTDENSVRRIALDRPDRRNAVDAKTLTLLREAVESAAADPAVRVIVLAGEGRTFCSGGDLGADDPFDTDATARTLDAATGLVTAIRAAPRPVVAELRGPAIGVGVSIALAADIAVARADSYLRTPFTAVGLMPDGGATALVAAAAGRSVAMRLFALGAKIGAHEAERHGLVAAAFAVDTFDAEFAAVVATLRDSSLDAFARTKRAVHAATLPHLEAAFAREREGQLALAGGPDFREAITAFAAKRPAIFHRPA